LCNLFNEPTNQQTNQQQQQQQQQQHPYLINTTAFSTSSTSLYSSSSLLSSSCSSENELTIGLVEACSTKQTEQIEQLFEEQEHQQQQQRRSNNTEAITRTEAACARKTNFMKEISAGKKASCSSSSADQDMKGSGDIFLPKSL